MKPDEVLEQIRDALVDMDEPKVSLLIEEALTNGISPLDIIERGLRAGMEVVGARFEDGQEFLPGLVLAGKIMQDSFLVLKPRMQSNQQAGQTAGRVLIGTVAGDLHDIGKNIVKTMLEVNNFEVRDLGVDVRPERFIEAALEWQPDVIAMSSLISTAMPNQKTVIEELVKTGRRGGIKVIVGGAAVTPNWAQMIGADGYSDNAVDAVKVFRDLVAQQRAS
jgi:corrinoid protein of di/trimethylamine methyltransferase